MEHRLQWFLETVIQKNMVVSMEDAHTSGKGHDAFYPGHHPIAGSPKKLIRQPHPASQVSQVSQLDWQLDWQLGWQTHQTHSPTHSPATFDRQSHKPHPRPNTNKESA